jgi:para-nitrobenzyl esterase
MAWIKNLNAAIAKTQSQMMSGFGGMNAVATTVQSKTLTPPSTEAVIDSGTVVGHFVREKSVVEFLGVPYAKPPLANLRFAPPEPFGQFSENRHVASAIGPGCIQNCSLAKEACPTRTSEDCLFANVWRPSDPTKKNMPVYVFIHGGGFIQSHSGMYDGARLASTGMTVVAFNYRMGALGFLATKDLAGNYGFQDQQFLLQWVRKNIHAFGGDPSKVTLGGQSAGGVSVGLHLLHKKSSGLFHRAIMQSPVYGYPHLTREEHVNSIGKMFLDKLNDGACEEGGVDCLRSASVDQILSAQTKSQYPFKDPLHAISFPHFTTFVMPFAYTLDEDIPRQPIEMMRAGQWNKVPVLTGYTKDESASFVQHFVPQLGRFVGDNLEVQMLMLVAAGHTMHFCLLPSGAMSRRWSSSIRHQTKKINERCSKRCATPFVPDLM